MPRALSHIRPTQAFCDGVCLISRAQDTQRGAAAAGHTESATLDAEEAAENEDNADPEHLNPGDARALDATMCVMSGPWYIDRSCVWAQGSAALFVSYGGFVSSRRSRFGGEADLPELCARAAVVCSGGTAAVRCAS